MLIWLVLLFFAVPTLLGLTPGIDARMARQYASATALLGGALGALTSFFLSIVDGAASPATWRFAIAGALMGSTFGLLILVLRRLRRR